MNALDYRYHHQKLLHYFVIHYLKSIVVTSNETHFSVNLVFTELFEVVISSVNEHAPNKKNCYWISRAEKQSPLNLEDNLSLWLYFKDLCFKDYILKPFERFIEE